MQVMYKYPVLQMQCHLISILEKPGMLIFPSVIPEADINGVFHPIT